MKVNQNWKPKVLEDLLHNTKMSDQFQGDVQGGKQQK